MLLQAQDFAMSHQIPFDTPIGALLVLALLAVLAAGLVVEGGLSAIARRRPGRPARKLPRRVATAGQPS